MDNVLLFGRTKSTFTENMVAAVSDYFDDISITLYLLGPPDEGAERRLAATGNVCRTVYDYRLYTESATEPDLTYLKAFEERVSPGVLWQCAFADRKLVKDAHSGYFHRDTSPFSHDELLSHVEQRAKKLEPLFDEISFDFVFGQQIAYVGGMITAMLANSRGVPFYRMGPARIKNRFVLLESVFERSPQVHQIFTQAIENPSAYPISEASSYIDNVQNGMPLYDIQPPPGYNTGTDSLINRVIRNIPPVVFPRTEDYYFQSSMKERFTAQVRTKIRKFFLRMREHFDEFDYSKRYIYFPCQVQPEQSLMVWDRYHTDLPAVIRNIAQSVPFGTEVYVKEHPNMVGIRSLSYYTELRKLPNVRVLQPRLNSTEIIQHALATVCLTSTVGLQSVLNGIPCITLDKPGYAIMDAVRIASGYSDLPELIATYGGTNIDRSEVEAYVAACIDAGITRSDSDFATGVCELIEKAQRRRVMSETS